VSLCCFNSVIQNITLLEVGLFKFFFGCIIFFFLQTVFYWVLQMRNSLITQCHAIISLLADVRLVY